MAKQKKMDLRCLVQAPTLGGSPSVNFCQRPAIPAHREHADGLMIWTTSPQGQAGELLTPREVARLLHVDPKTVTRWADAGKLGVIRTPGGHRRFDRAEVHSMATPIHQVSQKVT
jgi:excisionase family DNA binding protein